MGCQSGSLFLCKVLVGVGRWHEHSSNLIRRGQRRKLEPDVDTDTPLSGGASMARSRRWNSQ